MKNTIKFIAIILIVIILFLPASAGKCEDQDTPAEPEKTETEEHKTIALKNPLGGGTEITGSELDTVTVNIITGILGVLGTISLAIFVYGGIHVLFSRGNQEQIQKGKTILVWAAIGIGVILGSYIILQVFFGILNQQIFSSV